MLRTEFVRSMNANYERILLEGSPEERRYQYCILSRGGIRGLLPCSLRYLNGDAYLYYDITSRQSITQLYGKRCITREWLRDFIWSLDRIQAELGRFLLDDQNVLWYPEQVFQELESNIFSFLYIPYYEGDNGFLKLLEYLVEHIDYEDETLVECVYKMYEQYERNGAVYLQAQIFEDAKLLNTEEAANVVSLPESGAKEPTRSDGGTMAGDSTETAQKMNVIRREEKNDRTVKKGILSLLDGRKRKYKEEMESYRESMQLAMEGCAVAEDTAYEKGEELGRTIYLEDVRDQAAVVHRLYTPEGRIVMQLDGDSYTIGKKKAEADLVLEDLSVSRIHARIVREQESLFIEDMNSTNGTYKNGLRMQPYEKRKLEEGDEIRLGKVVLIYR